MTFVIGDIHGEIDKLKALLNNIYEHEASPSLIFIGDYINKGQDSKATIELLTTLKKAVFLMGNHEYYYLQYIKSGQCAEKVLGYGKRSTFIDFGMELEEIREKMYLPYKHFFDGLRKYHETDDYFISHSGLPSDCIDKDPEHLPLEKFLFTRYTCFESGTKIRGKKQIFGHTAFFHVFVDDVKIGVDTAAVYMKDNPLTAYCLEHEFFINSRGEKRNINDIDTSACPAIVRRKPYRYGETA